jgi:hypothetical protein
MWAQNDVEIQETPAKLLALALLSSQVTVVPLTVPMLVCPPAVSTQNVLDAQETAEGGCAPENVDVATQLLAPPVGLVATYALSLPATAMHRPLVAVVPGEHETAVKAGTPLIAVAVQEVLSPGLVDVRM